MKRATVGTVIILSFFRRSRVTALWSNNLFWVVGLIVQCLISLSIDWDPIKKSSLERFFFIYGTGYVGIFKPIGEFASIRIRKEQVIT